MFENNNYFRIHEQIKSKCLKRANMTSTPFLSIIIPAYKQKDILMQAVESAVSQITSASYEIVIVDNDTDEKDIATFTKKLQSGRYWRVSYYVNAQNLGMCGNHNRGALLAQGKYLTYLHTDDILCGDFVQTLWKLLSEHSAMQVLYFRPHLLKMGDALPAQAQIEHVRKRDAGFHPGGIVRMKAFDIIPYRIQTAPCEMVIKRAFFLKTGGYDTDIPLVFDTEFAMRCILHRVRLYWVDHVLFIKRYGESASHESKKEMIHSLLILLKEFCKHTRYPYQTQMVYYRVLSLCRDWQGHHTARQMEIELPKYMSKSSVIRRCQFMLRFYHKYFWHLHAFDEKRLHHEDHQYRFRRN